jgi:hypothetical protein
MSPSRMPLIFSTTFLTFVVSADLVRNSTLDLNLDLHLGHSKIPTQNWGNAPLSPCFLKDTGQLLTAVTTSVPQLGQSTKAEKPSNSPAGYNESILKMCFAMQILRVQKAT